MTKMPATPEEIKLFRDAWLNVVADARDDKDYISTSQILYWLQVCKYGNLDDFISQEKLKRFEQIISKIVKGIPLTTYDLAAIGKMDEDPDPLISKRMQEIKDAVARWAMKEAMGDEKNG